MLLGRRWSAVHFGHPALFCYLINVVISLLLLSAVVSLIEAITDESWVM